jgi:hypothetical protein
MSTLIDALIFLVELIILWIIVSIPSYIAAKVVTGGRATFGSAMSATLGGAVVYAIVLLGVNFFLGEVIGSSAGVFALLLALLAWLAVYRAVFGVGWLSAFAIAVISVVVLFVLQILIQAVFGVHLPVYFRPFRL